MPSPQPSSEPKAPTGQRETQRRGTIAAVVVALAFIGLLGWFMSRGGGSGKASVPPVPEGIPERPRGITGMQPGDDPQPGRAEGIHLDLTDKKDPKRQAGELILASMDPLEARHFAVERPEAWIFLRDGRTAHIRADAGKLYMPANEPESGTITGNVVAQLYNKRMDGARIDPKVDQPVQVLRTDSVAFNMTLGEVTTPDRFTFTSPQADCLGTGLKIVFNQVRERLELMRIDRGEKIIVRRDAAEPKPVKPQAAKPATAPGAAPAQPAAPAPVPEPPVETLYQIVFSDDVLVEQEQSRVKADKLQSWARTLDGKLPPNALTPIKFVPAEERPAGATGQATGAPATAAAPSPASALPPAAPSKAAASIAAPESDLVLTWTGPCTITPLDSAPAELKDDHVALRFTAERSGLVELSDTARGASGHAASIDYGATSRLLRLAGPGPASVMLKLEGGESLEAIRLDLNLGTGVGHIAGPGVLARGRGNASAREQVSWVEQADFLFATRDNAVVQAIRQATCLGNVRFASAAGTLRGEYARADFVSLPGQPSALGRLILQDKVSGISEKSGSLSADKIDVAFKPAAKDGDPEPDTLTAVGNVVGESEGSKLTSEFLEARFGRVEQGGKSSVEVTSAAARGAVHFTNRPENVSASADEMVADLSWKEPAPGAAPVRSQRVDLTGERVVLARADQTTITGTQMRLDGVARSLEVFGSGTFEHNEQGRSPLPGPSVVASWSSGMTFSDSTGLVDCVGQVSATAWPEPFTRDRVDADRIKITLTGRQPAPAGDDPAAARKEKNRTVRTADAFGSVLDREGGVNARIESVRFAPDAAAADGLRQEQVYYIEGPKILASHEAGTLDVPSVGRMVLSDRRAQEKPQPSGGPLGGDARGDSLFDWDGTMHMDRGAGTMEMSRNVRLTHRALADGQITNLVCETLTAAFRGSKIGSSLGDPDAGPTGLIQAAADGAVYAASGPQAIQGRPFRPLRELIADHVEYDATKGLIQATAAEGNQVTAFDAKSGTPQSAAALTWDLKADRITVGRPQTVTQPITSPR